MTIKKPSPLSQETKDLVLERLQGEPSPESLNKALYALAQWRARLLENTFDAESGPIVRGGPFEGMSYEAKTSDRCRVPRLMGTYEAALHPVIEEVIATAPPLIIKIGSAEGFYAVGLAMRLHNSIIWARDANETARDKCTALAEANGVAGRVKVGGKLTHADFDICRAQHTMIFCDIAGGEDSLLDPDRAKGLRRADVLVEVHEAHFPGRTERLMERFQPTHHIRLIESRFNSDSLPDWMKGLSDLDRMLALWEWRETPAHWLWMQRKMV